MKNRIFVAVASLVLAAVILLLLPPADPQGTQHTDPSNTDHFTRPTGSSTDPSAGGSVRLYSCNEKWLEVLADLAAQYTALTGTEVVVLGPQEDDCQQTLALLMESEDPPTVLCVHSASQLEGWKNSLLDLKDTALAAALCADSFGVYADGKLLAVPMDLSGFGLMVNAQLLGTKGALSRNDITDSQTLAMAAQILRDNSAKAFPTAQFDAMTALCLLLFGDAGQTRSFLDLYLTNCHTSGEAQEQFLSGECAFYLDGTWNYKRLASQTEEGLRARDLDILPCYTAGGMQYIFSTAWCVNAAARQEDIDATLEFLTWLVSTGEGTAAPIDALQVLTPFADGAWYGNQLEKKLLGYMQTEPAVVCWTPTSGDYTDLMVALQAYMEDPSDAAWAMLQTQLSRAGNPNNSVRVTEG